MLDRWIANLLQKRQNKHNIPDEEMERQYNDLIDSLNNVEYDSKIMNAYKRYMLKQAISARKLHLGR